MKVNQARLNSEPGVVHLEPSRRTIGGILSFGGNKLWIEAETEALELEFLPLDERGTEDNVLFSAAAVEGDTHAACRCTKLAEQAPHPPR